MGSGEGRNKLEVIIYGVSSDYLVAVDRNVKLKTHHHQKTR
jgi:hypothetical protein